MSINYNGGGAILAMTCIDEECARAGVKVFDGRPRCRKCGGVLVPYDDYDWQELGPEEDYDGTGPGFQDQLQRVLDAGQPPLPYTQAPQRGSDTFSCPGDLTGCPVAVHPTVDIPIGLYNRWIFLARQIPTEWIAYLKGEEIAPDHYAIREMYFPRQVADATHCEAEDGEIQDGTIAAVHSHVGMDAFFSGEDVQHMNHRIELVVNRNGKILANGRVTLECGRHHRGPAKVRFTECGDQLALVVDLKAKIGPGRMTFGGPLRDAASAPSGLGLLRDGVYRKP